MRRVIVNKRAPENVEVPYNMYKVMGPWGRTLYTPPFSHTSLLKIKYWLNNNIKGGLAALRPENGDIPENAEDRADEQFLEAATSGVSNPIVPVHR